MSLTTAELKVFNNLSNALNPDVNLGTRLSEILGLLCEEGTPTNAVAADTVLTVSGVVVHGEVLVIDNPAVDGIDVYEFLATTAQTPTVIGNIPVSIVASTTKSHGTLTMDTKPLSGDTVTIGTKVFTFVPVGTDTADGEVSIGADLAGAQAALVAAINGTDGVSDPHPLVSAGAFVANACTITALVGGVAGDAIATTETLTAATNIFAAATLGSGADCTAANAITALVAAATAHDTQGVGMADGTGDTVNITADIAGTIGNAIDVTTDMLSATLEGSSEVLSGGVNGTPSAGIKILVDDTYLYVCLEANPVTGQNWRRISLTSF